MFIPTINPRIARAGKACAAVTAGFWIVCATLVAVAPGPMKWVTAHMIHANLAEMDWNLTLGGVIAGLFAWSALAWLAGAALAWSYQVFGTVIDPSLNEAESSQIHLRPGTV